MIQLHKCLGEYQDGGVKCDFDNASWLARRPNVGATVQKCDPHPPSKACTQTEEAITTIDIAGRFVAKEMLAEAPASSRSLNPYPIEWAQI